MKKLRFLLSSFTSPLRGGRMMPVHHSGGGNRHALSPLPVRAQFAQLHNVFGHRLALARQIIIHRAA